MTKPKERPAWFPMNPRCASTGTEIGEAMYQTFEQALDAVLKAADEHGIVFVKKESLEPRKLYNFSCECSWLHKGVSEGHVCRECGCIFDLKTSAYSIYTEGQA